MRTPERKNREMINYHLAHCHAHEGRFNIQVFIQCSARISMENSRGRGFAGAGKEGEAGFDGRQALSSNAKWELCICSLAPASASN